MNIFFGFFCGWVCGVCDVVCFKFLWGYSLLLGFECVGKGRGKGGEGGVGVEMGGGGWGAQWEGVEGFVLHCCIVGIGLWLMG